MSVAPGGARITVEGIRACKGRTKPLVFLIACNAYMARLLDPLADILLVGNSPGLAAYGMETARHATLDMMISHGASVAGNASHALSVVDMPRGSYEESPKVALRNAGRLLRETGCGAVKLEGGVSRARTVRHLVDGGIAVMGHIGPVPRNVHAADEYGKAGGKPAEWAALEADARALDESGVFAMVLEGMVEPLARRISALTSAPAIGMGAPSRCDGRIPVTGDMRGLTGKSFRFVKGYAAPGDAVTAAVKSCAGEVRSRRFPNAEHAYAAADAVQPPARTMHRVKSAFLQEVNRATGHG